MSQTIVFVHGAWVTPLCWEKFLPYFRDRGYRCLAPAWPGHERPVEAQRSEPAPQLSRLGITEIVDHHAALLDDLDAPPLLVGHSFGGLIVQLLMSRGYGAAGVAIDSAPPKGVKSLFPSALRSTMPVVVRWRPASRPMMPTFPQFQYAFVNTVPPRAQREAYDRFVVPETGRIFVQAALSGIDATSPVAVDFAKPDRGPLLLVAGEKDHIVPAKTNRSNYERYAASPAPIEFREFEGRCHWIIAQEGWEEVAEFVAGWLARQFRGQHAA